MNVIQNIELISERFQDKPAIIFKEEGISFSAMKDESLKLANALRKLGIAKGDRIAFYLPNCPQYIYGYLACFFLGAVGVPLDFMLKTDELISCLGHSETKALIAMGRGDVDFKSIIESLPDLTNIILINGECEGSRSYQDLVKDEKADFDEVDIKENDPALIMYTSGTTGKPKGILLNYKHLDGTPKAMEYFVDLSDRDIKLAALPLSHIGGFIYLQNCITFGITLILMERFNPFEFLQNVTKYKVTCFHIVPPMYNAILTLKQIEQFDLSSLRWVVVFGAPSSPEILARFHQYCSNAKLLNGWGMTETCPPNTVTPMNSDKIASVGKPSPFCDIKILDDDGSEAGQGEIGEIVINGPYIMEGYYKDPQTTGEVKQANGLHTGDLGRFDEEGFLFIVGRKKEMIKVGGQIVYEPEVEAAFYRHEDVAEVAVIGIDDKMKGEAVKAYIVLKGGAKINAEELRYFAREHLANFKVPQVIEIKDELPKNRAGKIDKSLLKQEALA